MKVEQIYTGCLAQGAYYIQCCDEAAIIDPLREVTPYIERAKRDGVKIKYIFETHFHADFVSGHVTLAEKTGAPIIYGPNANPSFDAHIAKDGEEFTIGNVTIKVLHTPGHTMESTTYLMKYKGEDYAIFTGDTLFLGDVGRPDLAQKGNLTQDDLAGHLYDSLRSKIMPLGDEVIVYPAHGAGSACGKHMSKETVDTLGAQKKTNYALRLDMTKEEFISEVTEGLLPPPAYFPLNVKMNKEGYEDIEEVLDRGLAELSPNELEEVVSSTGAIVLDVRTQYQFVKSHIPSSIFIGLNGSFAPWVGALIADTKQPIVLVVNEGEEKEAVTRLARVGFDHTYGFLKGGITAWKLSNKEVDSIDSISAKKLETLDVSSLTILDVRKINEWDTGHIPSAVLTPLKELNDYLDRVSPSETTYIHCGGGYRSVIAISILKARGYHNLIDIAGGYHDIKETNIELT